MHVAVKVGIGLILLLVGAIAGMAATGFCPPAGPWPLPPWCSAPGPSPAFSDALSLIPQSGYGDLQDVNRGTPMTVPFEVALPATRDEVVLTLDGKDYALERVADYYYRHPGVPVTSGESYQYRVAAGSSGTLPVTGVKTTGAPLRAGLVWSNTPVVAKPGFVRGHAIMDAGGNIPAAAKSGYLWKTYDAMEEDGAEWVAYDYYWAYANTSEPRIVDEASFALGYAADDHSIGLMAAEAHRRGLKFFLMTELEWTVMPGEFSTGDNDAYMQYQEKKWTDGQKTVYEMGERLERTPSDPEANAYWDRWFVQFGEFMQKSATIAEKHDTEMLAIGKQIDGAMVPANERRWRALIADVRKVYRGKITQVLYTNEWSDHAKEVPWADDLDVITIYYYNRFSDKGRPSVDELAASMEGFNRKQFDPLYAKYQKPLLFLLPFQSRDHAARQEWFEPMATAPAVREDMMAQADLYEAFFIATLDEPWLDGVYTWGYWIEPGFDPRYSFEKSSTVRNKPASLVVRKWFAQVNPA